MRKCVVGLFAAVLACSASAGEADRIVDASGVKGGLVVVLGSDVELLGGFGSACIVCGVPWMCITQTPAPVSRQTFGIC